MKRLKKNWILIPVIGGMTWFVAASVSDDHSGHDHASHESHDDHVGHDHSGHDDHAGHNHAHGPIELSPDECGIDKETQFLLDIRTQLASNQAYASILTLVGQVKSQTNGLVQIKSPQNATLSSLKVSIGERVKKGQLLAVLNQNIGSADKLAYKVELENINSDVDLKLAEKERLEKIEGIIAKKQLSELKIEIDRLMSLQKEYQTAVNGGGQRSISLVSPIAGVVGDFEMSVGQQLSESDPILSIYNSSLLKIEATVYEKQKGHLIGDLKFSIVDLTTNQTHNGDVELISMGQVTDEETQTTKIILGVDNSDQLLKPGQQVQVDVSVKSEAGSIVIPNSAIIDIEGVPAVFVHTTPEVFKLIKVKTGVIGGHVEVLKGLKQEDRVVAEGAHRIKAIYLSK